MRAPIAVTVGAELPGRRIGPISATDIIRFAGAGGDFNPLHHDPQAAREAGFDTVIAMGQMQAGMLAAWVTDQFGIEHLREFSVKFTAPVRPGDTLDFVGSVAAVHANPPGTQTLAELDLTVVAGGVTVVSGRAVVVVGPAVTSSASSDPASR